jgi:phospholipase/carboxylesterase
MGFSQGACLALEYTARNASRYGGIIAFTGGLIGEKLDVSRYQGDFKGTPVFIGSSDFDPHVPEYRIDESVSIIRDLGGEVKKIIYPGMGHTINQDEIKKAKEILIQ